MQQFVAVYLFSHQSIITVTTIMSRVCALCGKTSVMQWRYKKLRGHFNPTLKERKFPNLQITTTSDGRRVRACTKCIRTTLKVHVRRPVTTITATVTTPTSP